MIRRLSIALVAIGLGGRVASAQAAPAQTETAEPEPAADDDDDDDDDDARVVIVPTRPREPTATRVRAEEAQKVPGSSGDAVRVIESLPGVGRASAGSGQLVIWGAPPQDTRIYVDGVPIPRLYHEGGLRSVVQPKLVEHIDLIPGGQGAMWGRGVGGMVSVTTATPERDRVGGRVGADILDASALVSTPLDRRGRLHLAVGVRASYVALWAKQLIDQNTAGLVPLPSYGDGQARLLWRPSSRNSVELVTMVSSDRFRRGVPDRDPALVVDDRRATDFGRIYARWIHTPRNDVKLTVTPYFGLGRSARSTDVGLAQTSISSENLLAGVRANSAWRPREWVQLDVGIDAELDVTRLQRVGSLGVPAREGDIRAFGQPPPDDLVADRWRATRVGIAPYLQAELSPWQGKLSIIPGVRLDPYVRAVDRRTPRQAATPKVGLADQDFAVEPRLAIVGRPFERLELRAATGLYRQSPAPEDLSSSFGTPSLPTAKALHTVLGVKSAITRTLSIDVTGFFTRDRALAMRSTASSPLPAHALAPSGTSRTWGVQVLLRQELFKGVFGWIAYTYMRAERRDRDGVPWRLSDYDQTHVLTGVLAWALPRGFELGARIRYATGFPRTPVVDAWYDAARNRYQPEFGAHNSIRVPQFAQLDARLAKRFDIRDTALQLFIEVLNVWNRHNAEELVYASDYSRRGTISGFPILPAVGIQWDF
jgi:TonB-dependent Receptor Plug Domain